MIEERRWAGVVHGGDEWSVIKAGRARPHAVRVYCEHGDHCPRPLYIELRPVPMAIASPRVLKAMLLDALDQLLAVDRPLDDRPVLP